MENGELGAVPDYLKSIENKDRYQIVKEKFENRLIFGKVDASTAFMRNFTHNCAIYAASSGVIGYGLGLVTGLFLSSLDSNVGLTSPGMAQPNVTLKSVYRDTKRKMHSYGKDFGIFGLTFSGLRCIIEGHRARDDLWNDLYAGAATGAIGGFRAGVKVGIFATISIATFSVAISYILDH